MCLVTKPYNNMSKAFQAILNAEITTKPITVYKRLTNRNTSPYKDMSYRRGKLYKVQINGHINCGNISIKEGLHAYTNIHAAKGNMRICNEKIVEMTIPKGSTIFRGQNPDYIVSNKLIWK